MSAEKIVRRALWRLVFWRVVGDAIGAPKRLLLAVAGIVGDFETAVYYFELDAARRYEALTDIDLGKAAGEVERYEGLK